ncbi:DUF4347 domain-containing protein [Galbibacter sp. PAP.153]|uniref:DUF4347 domain-containing protein n=1 Tax=Galbibacter sp. PAP.153 TaxID=3104623 RepID=UPI003007F220
MILRTTSIKSVFAFLILLLTGAFNVVAQQNKLIVVDMEYPHLSQLEFTKTQNLEVLKLTTQENPWKNIREYLQMHPEITELHLFAKTTENSIQLGGNNYSAKKLDAEFEISLMETLYNFKNRHQLLIYSCNIAREETGRAILKKLGERTLFNIAAPTSCDDIFSETLEFDFQTYPKANLIPITNL